MQRPRGLSLLALSFALGALSNVRAQDPIFTTIDFPGAALTNAQGINDRGEIVGRTDIAGVRHGYLLRSENFSLIDFPGASASRTHGINARSEIVGDYIDSVGVLHGFQVN